MELITQTLKLLLHFFVLFSDPRITTYHIIKPRFEYFNPTIIYQDQTPFKNNILIWVA